MDIVLIQIKHVKYNMNAMIINDSNTILNVLFVLIQCPYNTSRSKFKLQLYVLTNYKYIHC